MTVGRVARAALLSLLVAADWQTPWVRRHFEQGEEEQRQADRPLSYREWPSQPCDFSCQSRQSDWWRQHRREAW